MDRAADSCRLRRRTNAVRLSPVDNDDPVSGFRPPGSAAPGDSMVPASAQLPRAGPRPNLLSPSGGEDQLSNDQCGNLPHQEQDSSQERPETDCLRHLHTKTVNTRARSDVADQNGPDHTSTEPDASERGQLPTATHRRLRIDPREDPTADDNVNGSDPEQKSRTHPSPRRGAHEQAEHPRQEVTGEDAAWGGCQLI